LAFAFRRSARALAAGLPRQDHVYKTTDESFRFHNKFFDKIRCKLDSTENPRSFEKYPRSFEKYPKKIVGGESSTQVVLKVRLPLSNFVPAAALDVAAVCFACVLLAGRPQF